MRHSSLMSLLLTVSEDRLRPYGLAVDAADLAICKYLWNTALSEALYPLLQTTEVALRNHIHACVLRDGGEPDWLTNGENRFSLGYRQLDRIAIARDQLGRKHKAETPSALMGELTLGFWVSLFDKPFEETWRRLLKAGAFPNLTVARSRRTLLGRLGPVNDLRNRVFHHEPIWNNQRLPEVHSDLVQILRWICETTGDFVLPIDRFRITHNAGPLAFESHVREL